MATADIPRIFRAERERRGWTQEYVANALGITTSHVSKIESGDRDPSVELMEAFIKLFNLQIVLQRTAAHE